MILLSAIITTAMFSYINGQESEGSKSLLKGAEDLKTGNYKDVLTSFFQLAATDLAGDNKSFEFKSTLFGIKLRADSSLLVDSNYVRQTFARNFQFNFKLNAEKDFKITGLTAGFTYALVNKRDRTLANFRDTQIEPVINKYIEQLSKIQPAFIQSLPSAQRGQMTVEMTAAVDSFLQRGDTTFFPEAFKKFITAQSNDKESPFADILKNVLTKKAFDGLDSLIENEYKKIDKKPLWTVSFNSATSDFNVFDNASFETVFLQGAAQDAMEIDLRASFNYKDTVVQNDDYRMFYGGKAGLNFNLLKNKKGTNHLIEFKPHFEYNRVLNGLLPDEEEEKFLANAELRIRITDQLWIPLTIKYDLEENNVFGFLNVTWNMDVFKDFLSGSNDK